MKLIWWMLAGSLLTALTLTFVIAQESRLELWLGMLGPLVPAVASWIAMHRRHRKQPEGLTRLMIKAFAAKVIFFAGYITVLVSSGSVRPIPFVISFGSYFIALHVVEAIGLHRLQTSGNLKSHAEPQG